MNNAFSWTASNWYLSGNVSYAVTSSGGIDPRESAGENYTVLEYQRPALY